MQGPTLFIIVILLLGGVFFFSFYFSKKNVIIRTLKKIPSKPATGLKTNELNKVSGKALHVKEPLIAPFSKRKCVYYQIIIQQRVSTGKSTSWKTIVEDEKYQEFFIETKNDFVIVNPIQHQYNLACYLTKDKELNSGSFNDPTPELKQVLGAYNINPETFFGFNKRLRYKEGIIEIGEIVTVAGISKWKTLAEPIPNYPYSKIASLESTDKQKLIITDLPETRPVKR